MNKNASTKQKINTIADDDNYFQTFNSDIYRGHINKVEKMALRGRDETQEHPIMFNFNGGELKRSYFSKFDKNHT